jgi:pimeloyl-ACP methyl ester carboxylesterase
MSDNLIVPSPRKKRRTEYRPPLVVSIHGIRTRGEWQKKFDGVISSLRCQTGAFDYGSYSTLRFLNPRSNAKLVDKFYEWIFSIIKSCRRVDLETYDKRPSVVAHSLGTWIVGNAMLKHDDLRFDKLIFAGSILPRDFDWATLFMRDQVSFVHNEVGGQDPWPWWASHLVPGTGTSGSKGFESFSTVVHNVDKNLFRHSDSTVQAHIENNWIPVLRRRPSPLVLRHGHEVTEKEEISKYLNHTGTIIDMEAYGKLHDYAAVQLPPGLSLEWVRRNGDLYTFLLDRQSGELAGYINAMPVKETCYAEIRKGKLKDNAITERDIVPYDNGEERIKVFLQSIAIAERYRNWGEGINQFAYFLLRTGFVNKLIRYAKKNKVKVTHFLATAWTEEGLKMCESLGMREIGKDQFGYSIFELDFEALKYTEVKKSFPLRRLLEVYEKLES